MATPPFRRRERSSVGRHVAVLLLALLFHGAAIGVLLLASDGQSRPSTRPTPPQAVAMRVISSNAWAKNRGELPKDLPEKVLKPTQPKEPAVSGQVVDVVPGNGERPDPETKFLAETNNRTEKQTASRERTLDYQNVMKRSTTDQPVTPAQKAPEEPVASGSATRSGDPLAESERERQRSARLEVPNVERRTEVDLQDMNPDGAGAVVANRAESTALKGNSEDLRVAQGEDEVDEASRGEQGPPRRLNLLPSASVFGDLRGAPSPDDLKGVDEGSETSLNTREFRHAAYFNITKKAVGSRWNPEGALARRDPTRQIYGMRERVTRLMVSIDRKGRLLEAAVIKSCGIDFLDLEAVRAFERANPFLPPPEALLNEDGVLRYPFTFTLQAAHASGLQIVPRQY